MSFLVRADKHKELGDKYSNEALAILETDIPEALEKGEGIAELQERSEKLFDIAQQQYDKWEDLKNLEDRRDEDLQRIESSNTPNPVEQKAREEMKEYGGFGAGGAWLKATHNFQVKGFVSGNSKGLKYWDGEHEGPAKVFNIDSSKALAENVGATGGILVPAEFEARILAVMGTQSIIRQRATVIRMNRRTIGIPVLNQQGTVSGGASWYGGIVTYYKDEAAALTDSEPSWREVELVAHKLTGLTYASNELLADSAVALEDYLMGDMGFPGAMAHRMDYDYLRGSGVGKPEGILNASCAITTGADATNTGRVTADGSITYEDLTEMLSRALPSANMIWVASQSVMSTLLNMNGPSGNASYLWGSAQSGVPNTLLGRPIYWTDKLPSLGTVGDIMLIDPKYYFVGDRQAMTMQASVENKFENDQTTWRMTMRHDGRMWLNAPLTYMDGTTQVSPVVLLGAYST